MNNIFFFSHNLCIFLAGWAAINWLLLIYLIFRQMQMKSHKVLFFLLPASLVQWYFYQFAVCWQRERKPETADWIIDIFDIVSRFPVWALFLILLGLTGVVVCTGLVIIPWIRNHVTNHAIKEGIDEIQTGFCWYYPDGVVALKNRQMDRLAVLLTGSQLMNGVRFEETVKSLDFGNELGHVSEGNYLISADEEIWEFSIRKQEDPSVPCEMTAKNITAEYAITRSLVEKQSELKEMNRRLKEYQQEIMNTVTDQEILNVKARIHDDLGIALLSARQYLLDPEEGSCREVLHLLKEKVDFLYEDTPYPEKPDEYELMFDTAKRVLVTIRLDGELPQKDPVKHLIAMAIHECITNTIRHAGGDEIRIRVEKAGKKMAAISFTNNGRKPKGQVVPGGGLLYLQEMAEKTGCGMELTWQPEFRLRFLIPAGDSEDMPGDPNGLSLSEADRNPLPGLCRSSDLNL